MTNINKEAVKEAAKLTGVIASILLFSLIIILISAHLTPALAAILTVSVFLLSIFIFSYITSKDFV